MSDLMCDTQFYHAFCLSNIGRLYQTFISREENKSADWNNVILVKKFFDPETTLMANFCAVLCSDVGFQEVLQGLKSYTPEDAQILLSARRFLVKYLADFKDHIFETMNRRNHFRAVYKYISLHCQSIKRRHELFRHHIALGRGNIITERPDLEAHAAETKQDEEDLLLLFNEEVSPTSLKRAFQEDTNAEVTQMVKVPKV